MADDRNSRFELTTVLETSRMLIESKSSDFILDNLLLITMGKLLVTRAAILICDSEKNQYTAARVRGKLFADPNPEFPGKLKQELLSRSYFPADEAKNLFPNEANLPPNSMLFNLRTGNRHIGLLLLGGKATGQPFSDHELQFIEGLCIISSVAIANSQMFDELRQTNRNLDRRIHELNTLFDLSKEFNLLTDREKISRIFKFALLGQLFIRSFFLIYKNNDQCELLASSNINTALNDDHIQAIFDSASDTVVVTPELEKKMPYLASNNIEALVEVTIEGKKAAVIGVGKKANNTPLEESDYNFLYSLANLAVISIQKTYFVEERIEKERLEEEISIARNIQMGLLPDPIPEIKGVDLTAINISSSQVGGDYFDVVETPDGNHIIAIADVTGKGIPAALLMANLQSMLHVLLPVEITLSEATERINNLIFRNTPADKFITFFWAKYLSDQRILRYVNAGHNPPLLLRSGEEDFIELSEGGLLLGAMESMMPYEQKDIQLNPGDLVLSYTDGVNEAMNPEGDEEYGEERMMDVIRKNRDKPSLEIRQALIDDVNRFAEGIQYDDLTLIVFKVT